jgi:selenocysteine lyase/cysteine desulfurase
MYVRKSIAESLVPTVTGWFGQKNTFAFDVKLLEPAAGTRRFESGTPPIPTIYGALAGIKLLQELGLQNVANQIRVLTKALISGALELGIQIKTPLDSVGPLVVLQSKGAEALVRLFASQGVVCSSRHDGLRLSFHAYNNLDDVRLVLRILEENLQMLVTSPAAISAAGES